MALAGCKVYLHVRPTNDDDQTKHDAKKAMKKLSAVICLSLQDADIVVFHNGSETVLQNARALSIPCVTPTWLQECKRTKSRLSTTKYVVGGAPGAGDLAAVVAVDDDEAPLPVRAGPAVPKVVPKAAAKPLKKATKPAASRPYLLDDSDDDDILLASQKKKIAKKKSATPVKSDASMERTPALPGCPSEPPPPLSSSKQYKGVSSPQGSTTQLQSATPVLSMPHASHTNGSAMSPSGPLVFDDPAKHLMDPDRYVDPFLQPSAEPPAEKEAVKPGPSQSSATKAKGRQRKTLTEAAVAEEPSKSERADKQRESSSDDSEPRKAKKSTLPPKPKQKTLKKAKEKLMPQAVEEKVSPESKPKKNAKSSTAALVEGKAEGEPTKMASKKAPREASKKTKVVRGKKADEVKEEEADAEKTPVPPPKSSKGKSAAKVGGSPGGKRGSSERPAPTQQRTPQPADIVPANHQFEDLDLKDKLLAVSGSHDNRETLLAVLEHMQVPVADRVFGRCQKPTHLVLDGGELTPKVLYALAAGIPVLNTEWIFESLAHYDAMSTKLGSKHIRAEFGNASRWALLPLGDKFFHSNYCPSLYQQHQSGPVDAQNPPQASTASSALFRKQTTAQDRKDILKGKVLALAGTGSYPDNSMYTELLELLGATVVRHAKHGGKQLTCIVVMEDLVDFNKMADQKREASKKKVSMAEKAMLQQLDEVKEYGAAGVALVSAQWIIDTIHALRPQPYGHYPAFGTPYAASQSKPASLRPEPVLDDEEDDDDDGQQPVAVLKKQPGPTSCAKLARNQWNTQQLCCSSDSEGEAMLTSRRASAGPRQKKRRKEEKPAKGRMSEML